MREHLLKTNIKWPGILKSSHSGRVTREIVEVDYYGLHEITREKPVVPRYTTV